MINLITRFIRRIINREFYSDMYVRVDNQHVVENNFRNEPIPW